MELRTIKFVWGKGKGKKIFMYFLERMSVFFFFFQGQLGTPNLITIVVKFYGSIFLFSFRANVFTFTIGTSFFFFC